MTNLFHDYVISSTEQTITLPKLELFSYYMYLHI